MELIKKTSNLNSGSHIAITGSILINVENNNIPLAPTMYISAGSILINVENNNIPVAPTMNISRGVTVP